MTLSLGRTNQGADLGNRRDGFTDLQALIRERATSPDSSPVDDPSVRSEDYRVEEGLNVIAR